MNVNFYEDPKVLLVEEEHGMEGGYVATRMLSYIYQQGYYLPWSELMPVIYGKKIGHGIASSRVMEIVKSMMKYGLLSEEMFEKHSILTSSGIQKRWLKIIRDAKRKADIDVRYSLIGLINSSDTALLPEETIPIEEETQAEPKLSTQSKVKYSKVKKSNINKPVAFVPPTIEDVREMVIENFGLSEEASAKFAHKFVSWYEGKNWKVGSKKMKDWHHAIKTTWIDTVEELGAKYPKKQEVAQAKRRYLNDPKPQSSTEP
ncbi:hypothetical protein J2Y43_002830 [Dyadobacter sp. BE31]|nr:DUF4373 domain-containing protein [Dyadobacter sp. BE34]MDR7215563.1 hypothetical protein [Dyadobacter sp. BE31]